ncbi:MAG: imidazole glycerol phosphate synthase subunit HisH [Candidatus Izemoplasmataceae bacterium]
MVTIIDYDSGNLASLVQGLKKAGIEAVVSSDEATIAKSDALILPGVGAFGDAMEKLKATGLIPSINKHVETGKPLVGICLGMQLLYERSFEYGEAKGLGYLKGDVKKIETRQPVPHMGWNELKLRDKENPLFKYLKEPAFVYFVHSYMVPDDPEVITATTDYEAIIPAIVQKDNILAMQFHPEKSAEDGQALLRALSEMIL